MNESKKRRHFSASQKASIVRRRLVGKEPVSNLADELGVQPSQIHLWVKQLLDQADKVFERTGGARRADEAQDRRIEELQSRLADKNEVISELLEENVRSKKAHGGL